MTHNTDYMTVMHCWAYGASRMSGPPSDKRSKPFEPFFFVPTPSFQVGTAHCSISSRLKRDTHQLYDRSRDRRNIDPEGGSAGVWVGGGLEGGRGRLMLPRNCVRSVRNSLNHTRNTRLKLQNKSIIRCGYVPGFVTMMS